VSDEERSEIRQKLDDARKALAHVRTAKYRESLVGTIGTDPFLFKSAQPADRSARSAVQIH